MPRQSASAARVSKKLSEMKRLKRKDSDDDFEAATVRELPSRKLRPTASNPHLPATAVEGRKQDVVKEEKRKAAQLKREHNTRLRENAKAELAKLVADRPVITSEAASFPSREFPSWAAFEEEWDNYNVAQYLCFRKRTTVSRNVGNRKFEDEDVTTLSGDDASENEQSAADCEWESSKIPATFKDSVRNYWCTHGCWDPPKGNGVRVHSHIRWTGCPARTIAKARCRRQENGSLEWYITVTRQITVHNHHRTPALFGHYVNNETIKDDELLGKFDALVLSSASTGEISSFLSGNSEFDVHPQAVRNLVKARFGGPTSEARFARLCDDFRAVDGNWLHEIYDECGTLCAFAMQSRGQAEVFAAWPEVVVMDWTYSTNDRGYHLGALVVTTATGLGVSVYDFFALSERQEVLEAILNSFKTRNMLWTRIVAFIIDKDFTERAVLRSPFVNAEVFLCQVHAIRAVGRALAKHKVRPQAKGQVEVRFNQLIHCAHETTYTELVASFRAFLHGLDPQVLRYFERNWLNCHLMWCNVGRSRVFTCGNTTTNRIESFWKHLKDLIQQNKGLDKVCHKVLQKQMNAFRSIVRSIGSASSTTRTFHGIPSFLRACLSLVSDFAGAKIEAQWSEYASAVSIGVAPDRATASIISLLKTPWQISPTDQGTYEVAVDDKRYVVCCEEWTCSCLFSVSLRLPCMHIFAVSIQTLELDSLPSAAIPARWNLFTLAPIVPRLASCITDLSRLRYQPSSQTRLPPATGTPTNREPSPIEYVRVARKNRQVGGIVVLSRQKKRKLAAEAVEGVLRMLENSPSAVFYERLATFSSVVAKKLLKNWSSTPDSDGQSSSSEEDDEGDDEELEDHEDADRFVAKPWDLTGNGCADGVVLEVAVDSVQVAASVEATVQHVVDEIVEAVASENEVPTRDYDSQLEHDPLSNLKHSLDFIVDGPSDEEDCAWDFGLDGFNDIPLASILSQHATEVDGMGVVQADTQVIVGFRAPPADMQPCSAPATAHSSALQTSREHKSGETLPAPSLHPVRFGLPSWRSFLPLGTAADPVDVELLEQIRAEDDAWIENVLQQRKSSRSLALRCGPNGISHNDESSDSSDCVDKNRQEQSAARRSCDQMRPTAPETIAVDRKRRANANTPQTGGINSNQNCEGRDLDEKTAENSSSSASPAVQPVSIVRGKLAPRISGRQRNDANARKAKRLRITLPQWIGLPDLIFWMARHDVPNDIRRAIELYPAESIRAHQPSVKLIRKDADADSRRSIISYDRMIAMRRAIHDARAAASDQSFNLCAEEGEEYAVSFNNFQADTPVFSESYVTAASSFYDLKQHRRQWAKDLRWLETVSASPSELIDSAFISQAIGNVTTHIDRVRANLLASYKKTPLVGKFSVPLTVNPIADSSIHFLDALERIADTALLTDSIFQFALHTSCDVRVDRDCVVLESLTSRYISFPLPLVDITSVKYVISPRLINGNHWTISIIEFDWRDVSVTHWMYEPYMSHDNAIEVATAFNEAVLPFLERWLQRDADHLASTYVDEYGNRHEDTRGFPNINLNIVRSPRQDAEDGVSCGFLCLFVANTIVNGTAIDYSSLSEKGTLSENDLQVLRLRTMHLVLCDSRYTTPSDDDGEEQLRIHRIDRIVQKHIRS